MAECAKRQGLWSQGNSKGVGKADLPTTVQQGVRHFQNVKMLSVSFFCSTIAAYGMLEDGMSGLQSQEVPTHPRVVALMIITQSCHQSITQKQIS